MANVLALLWKLIPTTKLGKYDHIGHWNGATLQLLTCRFPARHLPTVPLLLVGLVLILAIPIVVTTLFRIVTRHTQTAVRIIRSSYRPSALDECGGAVSSEPILHLYPSIWTGA